MINKLIILSAFFCLSTQAQQSFSVKEAQEYGLRHNKDVKNALLNTEIAKKQLKETIATGLPQINAELDWQNFMEVPTSLVPASQFDPNAPSDQFVEMQFGIEHTTSAKLTANQLIFNGSYIVGLKAAKTFMNFARESTALTESQISDSIAVAYYNVLIASQNKSFLKKIFEVHEDIVLEFKAMYEQGFIEDLEVDRMTLVLSQMEIQHTDAIRKYDISEAYLKLMLGIPIEESIILTDSLEHILETCIDFELAEVNIKARKEYKLSELQVELMKLDMQRYKADKLPTVAAFASVSGSAMGTEFTAFDNGTRWYPANLVGLKVSIPLFDGLGGTARIQQARLKYEQAKNDKLHTEEALKMAHLTSQSEYLNAINNLNLQKKNLDLSKKIYEKSLLKYKEGLVSSTDLSQAGTDYLENNTNYSGSIYNLLISNQNYQRSLGK